MKLRPALNSLIVEDFKQLVRLCGGPGPDGVRKERLVEYVAGRLTNPVALAEIWWRLDPLSQKAVATAYYAGGEFSPEAFVAQYGELPGGSRADSSPVRGTPLGVLNVRFTSRETRIVNVPAPRSGTPT